MFFQLKPSPKQLEKLSQPSDSGSFQCPDRWEDFAPLLTIRSGKGFRPFNPFPMQIQLSDLFDRHSFILNAKGRQLGQSEFCLSKILHWALLTPGYNAVIISRTLADAYKLAVRMRLMVDSLSIKPLTDSLSILVLPNGSRVAFCQPGDAAARGEASVSCLMIDEFSYLREPELTLSAALPSASMLGDDLKVILIFTPNGKSNYSFKLLNERNPPGFDAVSAIKQVREGLMPPLFHWTDQDGWLKALLHWRSHPVYSQNSGYLEHVAKTQKLPWKRVLREHDLSFDEGEMQYIEDEIIDACAVGEYEDPEANERYFAGLDVSSVGADYFAFAVVKEEGNRLSLVHLYRARRRSMKRHLAHIGIVCADYKIEAALIEINSFGQLYFELLSDAQPKVKWERFTASQRTNIELLERMLMRLETRTIAYPPDPVVLRELRGLEQDPISGKIEAGSTGLSGDSDDDELHDDVPRAIALAIACFDDRPKSGGIDFQAFRAGLASGKGLLSADESADKSAHV